MEPYSLKRIELRVDERTVIGASAFLTENYGDKDIIPILKELVEMLEAPVLEDNEIF